jgi:hypothetical protein
LARMLDRREKRSKVRARLRRREPQVSWPLRYCMGREGAVPGIT